MLYSKPQTPCFDCKDRHFKCHSSCDKYKPVDYDKATKARNAKTDIDSYEVDRRWKLKQRYGR